MSKRLEQHDTPYNLLTIPMIPQPLRRRDDWYRVTMDPLLENDTRASVWLTNQEKSDIFLDFIYPEWLLLPEGETLETLLETLKSAGHVRSSTNSKKTKYTWPHFPKPKKGDPKDHERNVADFLNGVHAAVHDAYGVSCFKWDSRFLTKPLDGVYVVRKPDITCFFRTPEGTRNPGWEHVVTFGEVKIQANTKKEKESFLELAGKASCLLGAQDGRQLVSCIRFLGSLIYLSTFHRSSSISMCPYDIKTLPLQFLHILIGISLSDYMTIGFDTSIKWNTQDQVSPSSPSVSENSNDPDCDSDSRDFESPQPESLDDQHSQISPDSESRSGLVTHQESSLSENEDALKSEESSSVEFPPVDNEEAKLNNKESTTDPGGMGRKYVEVTDLQGRCLRIWLKSVLAISDGLVGQGTTVWEGEMAMPDGDDLTVVVKDSWIDPLRKYTEGMILHILEQHNIEGVPTLVSEEQVKTVLPSPNHPYPLVNSSTHFLRLALPLNSSFQLRLLSRLVIRPVGKLILKFSSLGELLVGFLDYIIAHEDALKVAGILHRDISPPNLWLASGKGRTDHSKHMGHLCNDVRSRLCQRIRSLRCRGVLGDWGYAAPVVTCQSEESSSQGNEDPTQDKLPSSSVEPVVEYDNCVPVRKVGSNNTPELLSVLKLTRQHDIMLLTSGDDPNEDPCRTIDVCLLYRTGTWSWMSAQLTMAGPEKPVMHDALDDLESFFYVLVGICTLYNGPSKQKSEEHLAQCYDKFFNTFKSSVLKTITIQSDLTWYPFIVEFIHPYFKPLVPLLTELRSEIISPLATNEHRQFYRKSSCNHGVFIKHIITTLSGFKPHDWADLSFETTRNDTTSCRPSSAAPTPPLSKTLLPAPPVVPKNFLLGRGIIQSDPGPQPPVPTGSIVMERSVRRTRESETDSDCHPPSPTKRTRLEPTSFLDVPRSQPSLSTGTIFTHPTVFQQPFGQ